MRGYQGSTFPRFRVRVTGMNLLKCTMRLVLEEKYNPGEYVMRRDCFHVQDPDGTDVYQVNLTSVDTRYLCGTYNMYFILRDASGFDHKNLVGTLVVLPSPEEDD
jgi:hypothetical protein